MRPGHRVRALLLALLFMGGTFVVPVVDGAVFHSGRAHYVSRPHLDAQGDQSCHGERCLLDAPIAGVSLLAAEAAPVTPVAESLGEPAGPAHSAPRSQVVPTALHSRAPPHLIS